jgi:hypothetical protein
VLIVVIDLSFCGACAEGGSAVWQTSLCVILRGNLTAVKFPFG